MATKKQIKAAEGNSSPASAWDEKPKKVTAETVLQFITNIHYADSVNNITLQVYPAPPEVWVTDADGNTDDELSKRIRDNFDTVNGYASMRTVLPDRYSHGCSVKSVGYDMVDGWLMPTEIRDLPCKSFCMAPFSATSGTAVVVNPLMPGIVLNADGEPEVWQTNLPNLTQTKLENVIIIRDPSTPYPAGRAYALPVMACIAEIDFANKAALQQVSRIGAPIILPKVSDSATPEEYQDRQDWFTKWGAVWGNSNASLIPPGIEFPNLQIRETTTAAEFIQRRVEWIRTYFNPMSAMQDAGAGIGTSDSGRMEMWATFISSEQARAEEWIEDIYNYCLTANGYEGYSAHIRLRRPSVDKSQLKIQAIAELAKDKAILLSEIRDNVTDILDLKETTPDVELELKNQYPENSAYGMFGNTVDGFTSPEDKIMMATEKKLRELNDKTSDKILRDIMHYPTE